MFYVKKLIPDANKVAEIEELNKKCKEEGNFYNHMYIYITFIHIIYIYTHIYKYVYIYNVTHAFNL